MRTRRTKLKLTVQLRKNKRKKDRKLKPSNVLLTVDSTDIGDSENPSSQSLQHKRKKDRMLKLTADITDIDDSEKLSSQSLQHKRKKDRMLKPSNVPLTTDSTDIGDSETPSSQSLQHKRKKDRMLKLTADITDIDDSEKLSSQSLQHKRKKDRMLKPSNVPLTADSTEIDDSEKLSIQSLQYNRKKDRMLMPSNVPLTVDSTDSGNSERPSSQSLQNIVRIAFSSETAVRLHAVVSARKLFITGRIPPKKDLIASGILLFLVDCLTKDDEPSIQFEAAWALTNIAAGTSPKTRAVVEAGAVPHFLRLLKSEHQNVQEQAVWALGNITGDRPQCRDYVISSGAVKPLLEFINPNIPLPVLRKAVWVIHNLCYSKGDRPPVDLIKEIIPALCQLIQHTDIDILFHTVCGLAYLTEGGNEIMQMVIDSGVVPFLEPFLSHVDLKIKTVAIRAVGNMAVMNEQTQTVPSSDVHSRFQALLYHTKQNKSHKAVFVEWGKNNVRTYNLRSKTLQQQTQWKSTI